MKLVVPVAVAIVLAAIVWAAFAAGKSFERARKWKDARAINPRLHGDLVAYVRALLATPEQMGDDMVILPPDKREIGESLLKQVAEAEAAKVRAERRLLGY